MIKLLTGEQDAMKTSFVIIDILIKLAFRGEDADLVARFQRQQS